MNSIIAFHAGHMTEAEYERKRAELRSLYGDSRIEAGARFEQALATLFYRSGWTQEKLAAREGKSSFWVSKRLLFGRFLGFLSMDKNSENLPKNLTERRFRKYWEKTNKSDERERFKEVHRLIVDDLKLSKDKRPRIGPAIKEQFADGDWHNVEEIAEELEADSEHVRDTLEGMIKNQNYDCKAERKQVAKEVHYRIFKKDRTISLEELIEKLKPIVDGLRAEGKKNMATMSPNTVAYLAGKLQKLLDEWAE